MANMAGHEPLICRLQGVLLVPAGGVKVLDNQAGVLLLVLQCWTELAAVLLPVLFRGLETPRSILATAAGYRGHVPCPCA
jgi:hypothetical protein